MGFSSEGGFDGKANPRRDERDRVCLRLLWRCEGSASMLGRVLREKSGTRARSLRVCCVDLGLPLSRVVAPRIST